MTVIETDRVEFAWDDLDCDHTPRGHGAPPLASCPCRLGPYTDFVDAFDSLWATVPPTGLLVAYRNGAAEPAWVHRAAWLEPRAVRDQLGLVPGAWRRASATRLPAGARDDHGRLVGHPHVPTAQVHVDDLRTEVLVLLDEHAWLCDAWAAVANTGRRIEVTDFDGRRAATLTGPVARMLWAFTTHHITYPDADGEPRSLAVATAAEIDAAVAATGLLDADETVQAAAARAAAAARTQPLEQVAAAAYATAL